MSYRHIENLYKNKEIFLFKQCYSSEKVDGTSAHIKYKPEEDRLIFFSGGSNHETFLSIFNQEELIAKFRENAIEHPSNTITVYGEAYGGKLQGMSKTYGKDLKFIAFEVQIGDEWLGVPIAERIAARFGFEFVPYKIIDVTEEAINAEMMADSEVAVRRGMGTGHMREGVVLRPLIELQHFNGGRIIVKHKRPEFSERKTTPSINDPEKMKILEDAKAIADEWVTAVRLQHVLDSIGLLENPQMEDAQKIIKGMIEDIRREAKGEIIESEGACRAIGKQTMKVFREYLMKH